MIATVQDGENLRVLTIINIGNDLGKNRARLGQQLTWTKT